MIFFPRLMIWDNRTRGGKNTGGTPDGDRRDDAWLVGKAVGEPEDVVAAMGAEGYNYDCGWWVTKDMYNGKYAVQPEIGSHLSDAANQVTQWA